MGETKKTSKGIVIILLLGVFIMSFIITYLLLKPDKTFEGNPLDTITFSPQGKYLLSFLDHDLILREVNTGKEVRRFSGHKGINLATFSSDSKYIVSASKNSDNKINLYEISTGDKKEFQNTTMNNFRKIFFSPDGRFIIAANSYETKVWNILTGNEESKSGLPNNLQGFSPNGNYMITYKLDTLELLDYRSGDVIKTYKFDKHLNYAYFSGDSSKIIVSMSSEIIRIYAVNSLSISSTHLFELESYYISSLAISSDGKYFVTSKDRGEFSLYQITETEKYNEEREPLYTFKMSAFFTGFIDPGIYSLTISPDNNYVVVGSSGRKLLFWNIEKYLD